MSRQAADPIGCVPSSRAVRKALDAARRRVKTLEFLLEIAEGVESRLTTTTDRERDNDPQE